MKQEFTYNLKAFLLAAGLGTRLRPLTDITPKCLLPIRGKPLLELWLENLAVAGVKEVLVNTHWLPEQVTRFLAGWDHNRVRVTTFYEPELLGSAGTLSANRAWAADASGLLILYADNFTDVSVSEVIAFHRSHEAPFSLGVFQTEQPRRCGIVEVDERGTVIHFEEKPESPRSNLAAAGIYVADPLLLGEIPSSSGTKGEPYDLGRHVLPSLVGRMKAYPLPGILLDIGTPESYLSAQFLEVPGYAPVGDSRFSERYVERLKIALDGFPHEGFARMILAFLEARQRGRTIFVMGNGGSGATASHWVCDMNKGCSYQREERFRMVCLNDNVPTLLAYANDVSYDDIFVEQLRNFIEPGDVVVGISGSGNSANVVKAIDFANEKGAMTIGLMGYSGGKMKDKVKVSVHANISDMQIVEDLHMVAVHICMQRLNNTR